MRRPIGASPSTRVITSFSASVVMTSPSSSASGKGLADPFKLRTERVRRIRLAPELDSERHHHERVDQPQKVDCVVRHGVQWELVDRKSTRLNSSHLGISYAVFCL